MLTVTINRQDSSTPARETSVSLAAFASPHLRMSSATRKGRRVWCVTEQCGQPDIDDLLNCLDPAASPFRSVLNYDGVALLLCDDADGTTVHILRTLHATVPLYVCCAKDRLDMSWDFLSCASQMPFRINPEACRRFILEGPQITTATIIDGLSLLAGGQLATWKDGELRIDNPRSIPRYETSVLSPGAQVTEVFLELIAAEIRPRLSQSQGAALELSGGQDSSCVAAALAEMAPPGFQTYGLTHAGVCGAQQIMRRRELVERFGFADSAIPSIECRPFSVYAGTIPTVRRVPIDELYRRGIEACLDALPTPPDLVVTGIGGDELTILAEDAIDTASTVAGDVLFGASIAPSMSVPTIGAVSAVESAFCRADMFLSRGIWPLNPLVSPTLAHFGQMLPEAMKRDRLLNKVTLAKLGLSDYFLFPRYRENFSEVYDDELRHFDFGTYFSSAMIHDFGIVDLPALLRQHVQFVNTGACAIPLICFANATRLEHVLRKLATYTR
jgi:hypothetical protein